MLLLLRKQTLLKKTSKVEVKTSNFDDFAARDVIALENKIQDVIDLVKNI